MARSRGLEPPTLSSASASFRFKFAVFLLGEHLKTPLPARSQRSSTDEQFLPVNDTYYKSEQMSLYRLSAMHVVV